MDSTRFAITALSLWVRLPKCIRSLIATDPGVTLMGYPHAASQKLTRALSRLCPPSGFSQRRSDLLAIKQSFAIASVSQVMPLWRRALVDRLRLA